MRPRHMDLDIRQASSWRDALGFFPGLLAIFAGQGSSLFFALGIPVAFPSFRLAAHASILEDSLCFFGQLFKLEFWFYFYIF